MKIKVGVFFGGVSSEREVSLNSGRNVYDNLDRDTYEPIPFFVDNKMGLWILPWQLVSQNTTMDIVERLASEAKRVSYEEIPDMIDFAFLTLHGKYGEDGCFQGLMELLGLPYSGSGVLGSALGMDKYRQQQFLKASGLKVPTSIMVTQEDWETKTEEVQKKIAAALTYPLFVKPTREGSSIGVNKVKDEEALPQEMAKALTWDEAVLVEEYLDGIEFSCIIIEEDGLARSLDVTEIHPQGTFYDYDDKYMPGRCRKFTPPKHIPAEGVQKIKADALRAFHALEFRSYGRIDGFFMKDGRVLITDPNSSSGMAPSSFFFEQAAGAGFYPGAILSIIIEEARKIHRRKKGPL